MSKLIVTGGNRLQGEIKVAGNKNSALKLMAASLLGDSPTILLDVPIIRDVNVMCELIDSLGAKVEGKGTNTLTIDPRGLSSFVLDPALSGRIRASVVLAAPLLVRFGKAVITPPGGDQIGERLLDTHFSMMKHFGVSVDRSNGSYKLEWKNRKASDLFLEEASVTATEMALMLASCVESDIVIDDAAAEPHVEDLADLMIKMGVKIEGKGSSKLRVRGKRKLVGVEHKVAPDHIEGGTFAIAAAITGGHVTLKNVVPSHYNMINSYLRDMGVDTKFSKDELVVSPSKLVARRRKFQTRPWPGFPTDLMSPFIVLATQTQGTVLCHDWMYEWRIFFVDDLISMGANIFIADPHRVVVTGPTKLIASKLYCKDIRAGMSVILAALAADGVSEIGNLEMVERGYERLTERLQSMGAKVEKIDDEE